MANFGCRTSFYLHSLVALFSYVAALPSFVKDRRDRLPFDFYNHFSVSSIPLPAMGSFPTQNKHFILSGKGKMRHYKIKRQLSHPFSLDFHDSTHSSVLYNFQSLSLQISKESDLRFDNSLRLQWDSVSSVLILIIMIIIIIIIIVIWEKETSNTRKLRKNSELKVRIELTTLQYSSDSLTTELIMEKLIHRILKSIRSCVRSTTNFGT